MREGEIPVFYGETHHNKENGFIQTCSVITGTRQSPGTYESETRGVQDL